MHKKVILVLLGTLFVFVMAVLIFLWWSKTCFVSLGNESKSVKIKVVDQRKLKDFIQNILPCHNGYFEIIENPNSPKKIRVKKINIQLADTFIGVRIGADRNKPDYSFWWERGKSGNLILTSWINAEKRNDAKHWKENLIVALTYLKNEMKVGSLEEATQKFDFVVNNDFGVVLQAL